jgi:hypothetical protein
MKKRTRSILDELNHLGSNRDTELQIESTANNIIESAINLLDRIEQNYDTDTAGELQRRFLNSIKASDPKKFNRGIQKIRENRE